MDKIRKNSYVSGVIGVIVLAIFVPMAINAGWNVTGQTFGVIGLVFGILGLGCFFKPDFFGPILTQLFENLSKNTESSETRNYKQHQNKPSKSPQIQAEKSNVNIYYVADESKRKKPKR